MIYREHIPYRAGLRDTKCPAIGKQEYDEKTLSDEEKAKRTQGRRPTERSHQLAQAIVTIEQEISNTITEGELAPPNCVVNSYLPQSAFGLVKWYKHPLDLS
ncbi:hypothetical protein ACQ4M3_13125 [Leptolyngbya sp. AN03gr2]|uniref:hypothetical protein n=1 Tax=unclassified Leptolyngbya TaxID=2650499 RepID=UPI003D310468